MAYPNSGKLSLNRFKDTDKKPDYVGEIAMQRSALKQLLEETDEDEIVIKLSGWNRSGQYGTFISVSWNNFKKREEAPAPKPEPTQVKDEDIPF